MTKKPGLLSRIVASLQAAGGGQRITTSADLAQALRAGWGTASGAHVSQTTALTLSAVYACMRLLADSVAMCPAVLNEEIEEDWQVKARKHPLWRVLRVRPNAWQTPFDFQRMLMLHLLMHGNAFAYISRSGGRVLELIPLDPARMDVRVIDELTWEYWYTPLNGAQTRYAWSEIMHIRGLSWKNALGIAPTLEAGREAIGLGLQQRAFAGKLFANGAQFSGFLRTDGRLSDEAIQRLIKTFADKYAGVDNAWKTPVLEEGLDFVKLTMTGEESQLLESRRFEIAEVARIFGVPPHMIGDVDKATSWGSGIEQQSIGFLVYTLMPHLTNIGQRMEASLLAEAERDRLSITHDTEPLTRGDYKSLQEALAIQRQNGVINANEWRRRVKLNPRQDDAGEDYYIPANMTNTSRPDANPQPKPQPKPEPSPADASASHLRVPTQARFARAR